MAEYTLNDLLLAYSTTSNAIGIPITVDQESVNYVKKQKNEKENYETTIKADDKKIDSINSSIESAKEQMKRLSKSVKKARGAVRKAAWERFNADLKDLRKAKESYKSAKHNLKDRISYAKRQGRIIGGHEVSKKEAQFKKEEDIKQRDTAEKHEKNATSILKSRMDDIVSILSVKELLNTTGINSLPESIRAQVEDNFNEVLKNLKGITISIRDSGEFQKVVNAANEIKSRVTGIEKMKLKKSINQIGSKYTNTAQEIADKRTEFDRLTDGKDTSGEGR